MAHKGIPKLVALCTVYYYTTILYTVQLCTCTKAYLQSIIPIQVGKCLKICLKICWHNLPGPNTHLLHYFRDGKQVTMYVLTTVSIPYILSITIDRDPPCRYPCCWKEL